MSFVYGVVSKMCFIVWWSCPLTLKTQNYSCVASAYSCKMTIVGPLCINSVYSYGITTCFSTFQWLWRLTFDHPNLITCRIVKDTPSPVTFWVILFANNKWITMMSLAEVNMLIRFHLLNVSRRRNSLSVYRETRNICRSPPLASILLINGIWLDWCFTQTFIIKVSPLRWTDDGINHLLFLFKCSPIFKQLITKCYRLWSPNYSGTGPFTGRTVPLRSGSRVKVDFEVQTGPGEGISIGF